MDNNFVMQGYDKVAEKYLKNRDQFKSIKYLDILIKRLKPGAKIIDLGCGVGIPLDRYLIDKGFKVTGIDISTKQIELARRNCPQATFIVKDMSQIKNGEYQVDAVISFYAIFHIQRESHIEIFKKINSFLSLGGLILITMGSTEWEGTETNFHGTSMYWSHYDSKKNREIIERSGFDIILDGIDISGGERHQVILARKIK
ncbi:class I SAM-dependent methyltransferase [Candidatus Gottesmanbacteria bacterium]|nr:class I SAM-dependent methyltransferase [Candidatus Gottesmanbacteria bacterium]